MNVGDTVIYQGREGKVDHIYPEYVVKGCKPVPERCTVIFNDPRDVQDIPSAQLRKK